MFPRVHGCFEEELKYPAFTRSMAAKRRSKILGQSSEMLLCDFGFYTLFLNIQLSFFPKKGLYPRELVIGGIYMLQI